MAERDLYEILGVARSATDKEIRAAYRELARKNHPDRNPGDAAAEERFKEASYASDVLLNKEKRKLYDEFGEIGLREGFNAEAYRRYKSGAASGGGAPGSFGFGNLEDLFGARGGGSAGWGHEFFGGDVVDAIFGRAGGRRASPRSDVVSEVWIEFVEAVKGVEKELTLQLSRGEQRTLKVRIPRGVADGGKVRLRGQGIDGGDLVLEVHVRPHPHFRREGNDLLLDLPITVREAFEGARVDVPTPDGPVSLSVPKGSDGGRRLRLRGKGVGRGTKTGDLIVTLRIVLPKASEAAAEAVARLGESYEEADVRGELRW